MSVQKPSTTEDEYFAREDAEKKRMLALQQIKAMGESERQRLQQLHHMRCPNCGMELHSLAMRDVTVAKCFNCHGVFLEEAVLQKLVGEEGYFARALQFFSQTDFVSKAP